jgi:hypothetical protein
MSGEKPKPKPSERFCKHGFLRLGEKYDQDIHNSSEKTTIEGRCEGFYGPEEIDRMKSEIKDAQCVICYELITDDDINNKNCMCCGDGHKFHTICLEKFWLKYPERVGVCPSTNTVSQDWEICINKYDTYSGGRRKSRKTKKSRKSRKSRKTGKIGKSKKCNKTTKKSRKYRKIS